MATLDRPNILWYCTDQQRWDTISALGNKHIRTPNLDRLVERGVAFTQAYTQCPICTPSRTTFLTGRYPAAHQVQRNGNDRFPDSEVLVTRLMADQGYHCGLIGKLHLSRAQDRVEQRPDDGYTEFYWSHHPQPDWPQEHAYADWLKLEKGLDPQELYAPFTGAYGPGVPEAYHQTTWCTEMALRFIESQKDPWLLSINPFDPHPPFDPPPEYLARYQPDSLPLPLFRSEDIKHQQLFRDIDQQTQVAVDIAAAAEEPTSADEPEPSAGSPPHSTPPSRYDPRAVKACYYAEIELIDTQFGRLLNALEAKGELENTLVVFTSDHGELLGDHGLIYKGCRFYEGLTHVPLIVSWPGRYQQGLRSDALVELVDLPETLLKAAGMEIPEHMQGRSLHSLLSGSSDLQLHKSHVICEYNDALNKPAASHGSMYFDGRYKISVYHGTGLGELYDLQQDPGEFNDLWGQPSYEKLKAELLGRAFDALAATTDPGIPRSGSF